MAEPVELNRRRDRDESVRRMLGLLADLSPEQLLTHAMPDEVWTQLQESLRTEGSEPARIRPVVVRRWLATLTAAAVCIVVAGSLIRTQQEHNAVLLVAQESSTITSAGGAQESRDGQAPAAAPLSDSSADRPLMMPRRVLASGTDYAAATMGTQVQDLLQVIGVGRGAKADAIAQQRADLPVGVAGFTATATGISRCLTGLAVSPETPVILIDRATFMREDAGIIVVAAATAVDALDIWVVRPTCDATDPAVIMHLTQVVRTTD